AGPAGRAGGVHQGPLLPAPGAVWRGGPEPGARPGGPPRAGAGEVPQAVRVPLVQGGRARFLLLPPADVPARAGDGWLEEALGLLGATPRCPPVRLRAQG